MNMWFIFPGLSLRAFTLTYDRFIEESQELSLNVFFRESHSRGATAHLELKQRNANQDFKTVISYFFGIVSPGNLYEIIQEISFKVK